MPDPEDFDRLLPEYIRAKRELMYWRLVASLKEEQLQHAQSNWTWRLSALFEFVVNLRHDWKIYAMLGLCSVLALLFSPLLLLVLLIPPLRKRCYASLMRIKALREVRDRVQIKIRELKGIPSEGDGWRSDQVMLRPQTSPPPAELNKEQIQAQLLQQLSPKKRTLLERFHQGRTPMVGSTENTQAQSLSVTESSLLRIYASAFTDKEKAEH
jgi:hypothetical protein